MSSVHAKILSTIVNPFHSNKSDRDVMPACVATSFSVPNDVYKREFVSRGDEDSMASSPEFPQYQDFPYKFSASSRQSPTNDVNSKRDARDEDFRSAPPNKEDPTNGVIKGDTINNCVSSNNYSRQRSSPPMRSHPLKRRILFGDNGQRGSVISSPSSSDHSDAAKNPGKDAKKHVREANLSLNSGDILRQMYATFGSAGDTQDTLTRFKRSSKDADDRIMESHPIPTTTSHAHSDVKEEKKNNLRSHKALNLKPHIHEVKKSAHSSGLTEGWSPRSKHEERSSSQNASLYHIRTPEQEKYTINHLPLSSHGIDAGSRRRRISSKSEMDHDRHSPKQQRLSSHSDVTLPKHHRHSRDFPATPQHTTLSDRFPRRERGHGAKFSTNPDSSINHDKDLSSGSKVDRSTSPEDAKCLRYSSSSEPSDNVGSDFPHQLANIYKQNVTFPYMNPLLCPPALSAFGLPASGVPFGFPGLPHPNPMMFGANPYLTNSLLLREMMNQAGASNFMSMLPGPNVGSLPLHPGLSMEQMQAIQQLHNSTLFQKPPMVHPGMMPTTALSAMQNPLLQAMGRGPPLQEEEFTREHRPRRSGSSMEDLNMSPCNIRTKSRKSSPHQSDFSHSRDASDDASSSPTLPPAESPERLVSNKRNIFPGPHHSRLPEHPSSTGKMHPLPSKPALKRRCEKRSNEKSKCKGNGRKTLNGIPTLPFSSNGDQMEETDDRPSRSSSVASGESPTGKPGCYKNLTRERRLVANARERTRVHTISSAFDELRGQIPSYSCNQKLSKLAILRIACSYIRTLSVLAGRDESTTFGQGVDQCTRVLQSESRARSRRKSNKAQIEWEMVNYERHKGHCNVDYDDELRHAELHVNNGDGLHVLGMMTSEEPDLVARTENESDLTNDEDKTDVIVDVEKIDVLDDVTNRLSPDKSSESSESSSQSDAKFVSEKSSSSKFAENSESGEISVDC
ncbi:uncharacterized protein LOC143469556 isoform X1 [Clavelina lepadiformis]|uniref:uncharacterized protein LOC143469556 isoform X1 n=1 Tax=Clavelina lepadiformis TaxID=159417 RepID=UPI004041A22D